MCAAREPGSGGDGKTHFRAAFHPDDDLSIYMRGATTMSIKVFMPLLNYQLFIFFRKFFSFGLFVELEALRFAQFHVVFHAEHGFTVAMADMNVNRAVVVAVNENPEAVLFKNGWHG